MRRAVVLPFPDLPRDVPMNSLSAQEKLEITMINLKNHQETVKSNVLEQAIAVKEGIRENNSNPPSPHMKEVLRKQTTNEIVASLQSRFKGTVDPVLKPPTYAEQLLAFGRLSNDSPLRPIEEAVLNMTIYEMHAAKGIEEINTKRRLADVPGTPAPIRTSSITYPSNPFPIPGLPPNTPTGPRAERVVEKVQTSSYDASRDPRLRR
ncbi:MAG: hypothetical protein MMC33_002601 [Icmadophila ericetorum]|nr:hypothetical protein [Icmadophila ericetorum]